MMALDDDPGALIGWDEPGRLIGLIGAPGAGKDTVAALLSSVGYRAIAFADLLRLQIFDAWGCDALLFRHPATKERPVNGLAVSLCDDYAFIRHCKANQIDLYLPRSPRWIMQTWAEWRCLQDPHYWAAPVGHWIDRQRAHGSRHQVISDVRKPVEAELLRSRGGHLLRVHRPGARTLAADTAAHVSEQHRALAADGEIHNDGDFDHLAADIARALRALPLPKGYA